MMREASGLVLPLFTFIYARRPELLLQDGLPMRELYCREKVQDICGNLLGEGGSQMSNFLTSAVRARYSRVNHDVPLKDYM